MRRSGDAAAFFDETASSSPRTATFFAADRKTLVVGSTQRIDRFDQGELGRGDIDLVRRRSGGSAVLLVPGEYVWLDVHVERTDPLWDDDVGRAMWWLGELWRTALFALGRRGEVHLGPLERRPWSDAICFAGVGAGEVMAPQGGKLVGISQRRDRHGARLSSLCHLRWRAAEIAALIGAPPAEIQPLAAALEIEAGAVVGALTAAFAAR